MRTHGRKNSSAFPKFRWGAHVFSLAGLRHPMCPGHCCHPARKQTNTQWSRLLLSQDSGAGPCSHHHPWDHSPCHCFSTDPQFNGEGHLEDNISATSDLAHHVLHTWGHQHPYSKICFNRNTLEKQVILLELPQLYTSAYGSKA